MWGCISVILADSDIQGYPCLNSEFEANLDYTKLYLFKPKPKWSEAIEVKSSPKKKYKIKQNKKYWRTIIGESWLNTKIQGLISWQPTSPAAPLPLHHSSQVVKGRIRPGCFQGSCLVALSTQLAHGDDSDIFTEGSIHQRRPPAALLPSEAFHLRL